MTKKPLEQCYLYLCTPYLKNNFFKFITQVVQNGVDIVQLRDKNLNDKDLLNIAKDLSQLLQELNTLFIVNDRVDLALLSNADGLHLGQEDLEPSVARQLLGEDKIVGLSTHSRTQIINALNQPVNYISVGPIAPTPTKPGRPGTGIGIIKDALQLSKLPFFITGAITPQKIIELKKFGSLRYVVVRYLTESTHPSTSAAELKKALVNTQTT